MQENVVEVLGVDVGGVIIDNANDHTDTSFMGDNFLKSTAVPGAFPSLGRIVAARFQDRAYTVSKCGTNVERKTRLWMPHNGFHDATGIPPARLRFCKERHQKAGICREIKATHFVDDKLEVLGYLLDIVPHLYLFRPKPKEVERYRHHLSRVTRVESWAELERLLVK